MKKKLGYLKDDKIQERTTGSFVRTNEKNINLRNNFRSSSNNNLFLKNIEHIKKYSEKLKDIHNRVCIYSKQNVFKQHMSKKSCEVIKPINGSMAKENFQTAIKSSIKKTTNSVPKRVKFNLAPIKCDFKDRANSMSVQAFHKIKSGIINSPMILNIEKKEKTHKRTIKDLLIID